MSDELEGLARRLVTGHKSDGRKVFDERAKAEVVALAIRPGTSVSRLARQLDINANQLSRWIREQGQGGRRCIVASQPAFVPVEIQTPAPTTMGSTLSIQVRMDSPIVYGDETEVQVLNEPGRNAQAKSYMWVQMTEASGADGAGPPIRLFAYSPSRSTQAAMTLYEGMRGAACS